MNEPRNRESSVENPAPSHDSLWDEIHECLDRREDPLSKKAIQQQLLEHPELLEEVVEMMDSLASLKPHSFQPLDPFPTSPLLKRKTPIFLSIAIAVAAMLVIGVLLIKRNPAPEEPEKTRLPLFSATPSDPAQENSDLGTAPSNSKDLEVLDYEMKLVTIDAEKTTTVTIKAGERRRSVSFSHPLPEPSFGEETGTSLLLVLQETRPNPNLTP